MEGFTMDIAVALATVVASAAVIKYKVAENDEKILHINAKVNELLEFMNSHKPMLSHMSRVENAYGNKLDDHTSSIVELHQRISQAPSMNEVRAEFVSKEMFAQMEKHIDEKFNRLDNELNKIDTGIQTILNKLK